jgi:hypothetical protein
MDATARCRHAVDSFARLRRLFIAHPPDLDSAKERYQVLAHGVQMHAARIILNG